MITGMNELINRLAKKQKAATATHLAQISHHVAAAPFTPALLEADEPLWGSFWQFDVISPGYRLPALELNLLRATRLDQHWPPATTPQQFLADLQQAAQNSQAGIWLLPVAGHLCLVFAAPPPERPGPSTAGLSTLVWYCATTQQIHAGYLAPLPQSGFLAAATALRTPAFNSQQSIDIKKTAGWLTTVAPQPATTAPANIAAQLDAEILRQRLRQLAL